MTHTTKNTKNTKDTKGTKDTNLQAVVGKIQQEAAEVNLCIRRDIERLRESMEPLLCEILDYGLLTGGKRVRPLLVVMSARLCGNRSEDVYRLGMAFEYLHAATLFHDDIIDHADLRRGQESVAKKYGTAAAILTGDFLHARSMFIVGDMVGGAGLASFCGATSGMVDGEFLQLRNADEFNLSELDYYRAVMGKTGLLISAACEVGGIYGAGSPQHIKALKVYGEKLGSAFQIIDDLLDYQGDTSKTGKSVGNDLAEGKMTLPLILALGRADAADKSKLQGILADVTLRATSFETVYTLIEKYDGFLMAYNQAEQDVSIACEQLEIFSEEAREEKVFLRGLAYYVLTRNV